MQIDLARFKKLRADRDDAHAVLLAMTLKRRNALISTQRLRALLVQQHEEIRGKTVKTRSYDTATGKTTFHIEPAAPDPGLERQITESEEEYQLLNARAQKLEARWGVLSALVLSCEEFLQKAGLLASERRTVNVAG